MSSLNNSIGSAMAEVMQGQAIGDAFGRVRERAEHAIELTHEWAAHAKKLENDITSLKIQLNKSNLKQVEYFEAKETLIKEYNLLVEKYNSVCARFDVQGNDLQEATIKIAEDRQKFKENVAFGRQLKMRLSQMEKALQHSSADKESLRVILEPYKQLVERLNLQSELPPDLLDKAEDIWNKFIVGELLVVDANIQKIIDEAPVPDPIGRVFI